MARALALITVLLAAAACADTDTLGSGGSDNTGGSSAGGNNTGGNNTGGNNTGGNNTGGNGVGGNNTGGNGAGGNNTGGNGAGGSAPDFGPPANDLVSAGTVSTNAKYRLVWTMGQSTINQGQSNSTSYRLQGGLIGANGSAQ